MLILPYKSLLKAITLARYYVQTASGTVFKYIVVDTMEIFDTSVYLTEQCLVNVYS